MSQTTNQKRVLALDVRPRSFGYVVLEDPDRLLDWGARSFRNGVNAVRNPVHKKLASLLEEFAPSAVILKNILSRPKKSGKRKRKYDAITQQVQRHGIAVRAITARAIRSAFGANERLTKYQVASAIAARFPELAPRLPPKRKPWQSEDYRMSIFDAAALGVAYFSRYTKRSPDNSAENPAPSEPT